MCYITVPVWADASNEHRDDSYSVWLTPGHCYAALEIESESLAATSTDDRHELY